MARERSRTTPTRLAGPLSGSTAEDCRPPAGCEGGRSDVTVERHGFPFVLVGPRSSIRARLPRSSHRGERVSVATAAFHKRSTSLARGSRERRRGLARHVGRHCRSEATARHTRRDGGCVAYLWGSMGRCTTRPLMPQLNLALGAAILVAVISAPSAAAGTGPKPLARYCSPTVISASRW